MREPDVHVAVGAEGAQELDLGRRDAGVAEQREPRRQVGRGDVGAQLVEHLRVPLGRRRAVDALRDVTPQLGLPRAGRPRWCAPAPSVSLPCSHAVSSAGRWVA